MVAAERSRADSSVIDELIKSKSEAFIGPATVSVVVVAGSASESEACRVPAEVRLTDTAAADDATARAIAAIPERSERIEVIIIV